MTEERHPCADGLTPDCFRKYPDWAKMMFAQKLMGTLFPPEVTKNLPTAVTQAFGQPPPDWPADQPMTPALSLAPPPGIIVPAGGGAAPMYTAVGAGAGGGALAGRNVVGPTVPWFKEIFTTLNPAIWTEYNYGGGANTIVAGRLKQTAPLDGGAEIDKIADATIPGTFDWSFDLTFDTDLGGMLRPYLRTGTHILQLGFNPPTEISFRASTGWQYFTVDNFLGTTDTWKLVYTGALASLYRGSTEIFADKIPFPFTSYAGVLSILTTDGTTYIDNIIISGEAAAGTSPCD